MQFMADIGEKLNAHSYPATTSELVEAYGEMEFDADECEPLGEVLERLGEETFEDSEAARTAALSAVGEGAIGRKGYSDRDAPTVGEDTENELLSF